jgi:hypothetical protein
MATPVDTGRARSNWQVAINGPATGESERADPSGQIAIAMGRAVIATAKEGQAIHITNNLPYIAALNDGSSAQAPKNFVQEAVRVAATAVREARLLKDTF